MTDLKSKRIVIAGGSGFLGLSLAEAFGAAGAEVTVVSRSVPKLFGAWKHVAWDGRTLGDWQAAVDGCDAVVNLAGRTVNCIKTPDHKDEILRSRVESTRVLGDAMRAVESPPPVWVQMSTAHLYGDPPSAICTEESAEGIGLAPTVARAWEAAFSESKLPNQRGVVMRTSFVVGRDRGAGGKVASGTQGMSWIHEDDINAIFIRAIVDETMPIGLPAFEWMVRIGAPLFLQTDPELVLYGRYVIPKRLMDEGFEFRFAELEPALRDLHERR